MIEGVSLKRFDRVASKHSNRFWGEMIEGVSSRYEICYTQTITLKTLELKMLRVGGKNFCYI